VTSPDGCRLLIVMIILKPLLDLRVEVVCKNVTNNYSGNTAVYLKSIEIGTFILTKLTLPVL